MKSIIRVEKHTAGYSIIDNTGLNDYRLGLKARGLLGYLLTKPDTWEVTVQGIISQVPEGRDAVQAALKELERFGYAEYRTVRGDRGRVEGKKWVIIERPLLKQTDNELFVSASSDHRQTGFPIIGKTDNRKNRLSENPLQVSTDTLVRTDYEAITVTTNGRQKKSTSVKDSVAGSPPPIPGAPPAAAALFSDSGWTYPVWEREFLSFVPGSTKMDAKYYFERCLDWSNNHGGRSKNWIKTASKFMSEDLSRKQTKPISHATNQSNNKSIVDPVRAIDRAARFAERNRSKVGAK